MNARTRSDILAAASGMVTTKAARALMIGSTDDAQRVALEALEFAIDYARDADEIADLKRENEALRSNLREWEDDARANLGRGR